MNNLRRYLPVISATIILLAGLGWIGFRFIPRRSGPSASGNLTQSASNSPHTPASNPPQDATSAAILARCLEVVKSGKDPDPSFIDDLVKLSAAQYRQLILALVDSEDGDFKSRMNLVSWLLMMDSSYHQIDSLAVLDAMAPHLRTDGKIPGYFVGTLIGQAGGKDPKFAADWLLEHSSQVDPQTFHDSMGSLLTHAANTKPAEALAILKTLPEDQRNDGIASIGRGISSQEQRSDLWNEVQKQTADMAPEDAAAFRKSALEGIADGLTGIHRTADGMFTVDGAKFENDVRWIESAGLSPEELGAVANHLEATHDGAYNGQWLDWLATNVPSGASSMMTSWATQNPQAAEQWLTNNASSPGAPSAIEAFLISLGDGDPQASARVIALLPEDQQADMREQVTQGIAEKAARDQLNREAAAKKIEDFLTEQEGAAEEAQAARKNRQR